MTRKIVFSLFEGGYRSVFLVIKMFARLFGKKPPAEQPVVRKTTNAAAASGNTAAAPPHAAGDPMKTVTDLDDKLTTIDLRISRLEKQVQEEVEHAKAYLEKNDRNRALACMKKKKMYEGQVEQLVAQRANLENMKFTVENAALNRELLESQRRAANELGRMNAGMDAGNIDDHIADVQEQMEEAKRIADALGQPLGDVQDDDELLGELNDLMTEGNVDPALSSGSKVQPVDLRQQPVALPAVPVTALPATTTKPAVAAQAAYSEEDEAMLRELEGA